MHAEDPIHLWVTLWPSLEHFFPFANDRRIQGIRLNPAMIEPERLRGELALLRNHRVTTPLFFDVKGRQLRVETIHPEPDRLRLSLNHRIEVETPTPVLFKAGNDLALLERLEDGGKTLVFAPGAEHGPTYTVKPGESLHIRHASLEVDDDPLFTDIELCKIEIAKQHGITRWFLSYVEKQSDVDQLRQRVGADAEIWLKIESKKGLQFATEAYQKQDGLRLVAACGDLYVELDQPHEILPALEAIILADPDAVAASRMMLSITLNIQKFGLDTPDLADFAHLSWLRSIGYRTYMLCDEICLDETLLNPSVGAFNAWRRLAAKPA